MDMRSFCEIWEEIHTKQEWGKYPPENLIRFIARNYYKMKRESVKILDFGCGGGACTWFLAREGFDVFAFDGSPTAVKKALQYTNTDRKYNVHFAVMDGIELKYEDDFFDCVVDNVCIYSNLYSNICRMYKEVYRVLKKGGKLYSSSFGIKTVGYGTGNCLENGTYEDIENGVLANRGIAHFYDKEEIERTIANAGFHNI